jgi:hypothetical protein
LAEMPFKSDATASGSPIVAPQDSSGPAYWTVLNLLHSPYFDECSASLL